MGRPPPGVARSGSCPDVWGRLRLGASATRLPPPRGGATWTGRGETTAPLVIPAGTALDRLGAIGRWEAASWGRSAWILPGCLGPSPAGVGGDGARSTTPLLSLPARRGGRCGGAAATIGLATPVASGSPTLPESRLAVLWTGAGASARRSRAAHAMVPTTTRAAHAAESESAAIGVAPSHAVAKRAARERGQSSRRLAKTRSCPLQAGPPPFLQLTSYLRALPRRSLQALTVRLEPGPVGLPLRLPP